MVCRRMWIACAASCIAGIAAAARGDITGTVKLEGKAPEQQVIDMSGQKECADMHPDPVLMQDFVVGEKGELANVVVSIKTDTPAALGGKLPTEPARMTQKGCMYEPHVLAMMVGQPLVVANDDATLHNVHGLTLKNQQFNVQQPTKDPGKEMQKPTVPEYYRVKCDVHPWMSMWIAVINNPFFAVTNQKGEFTIKGTVPDGEYTLEFWHEQAGKQTAKVTVKDGKASVDVKMKAEDARGPTEKSPVLAKGG